MVLSPLWLAALAQMLTLFVLGAQAISDCDLKQPCPSPCSVTEYCEECLGLCAPCEFLCNLNINDRHCRQHCRDYVIHKTKGSMDTSEYKARTPKVEKQAAKSAINVATPSMSTVRILKASSSMEKSVSYDYTVTLWVCVALLGVIVVAVCVLSAVYIKRSPKTQQRESYTECSSCHLLIDQPRAPETRKYESNLLNHPRQFTPSSESDSGKYEEMRPSPEKLSQRESVRFSNPPSSNV